MNVDENRDSSAEKGEYASEAIIKKVKKKKNERCLDKFSSSLSNFLRTRYQARS